MAWNGNGAFANATISRTTEFTLDGQAGRPKVYGVCGMAVGDVLANDGGADELVIGSLDGHLLVYDLDPTTGAILGANGVPGAPAFQTRVEGSLGNYNSIVIADLDGNGVNELYVAGSLGLRKWIFQ